MVESARGTPKLGGVLATRIPRWIVLLLALALLGGDAVAQGQRRQRPGRATVSVPEVPRDEVICFALYTVHEGTLKLTAQLYPLKEGEDRRVRLEVEQAGQWRQVAEVDVIEDGWTAPFRVENWDAAVDARYRVRHGERATYEGRVRRDPVDAGQVVIAAFTGNSIHPAHGGDIPKDDIIANVQKIDADMLFFAGDQVYDHHKHLAAWLKFGRDFGEIIKDRPTVTIPDDHDVGQSNLWGHGGRKSNTGHGNDGGYFKPVRYVQMVERAQTSHLPDPHDPTPIERGIGVYYTDLTWGGVSFAIIEDRKWKTGPKGLIPKQGPRPDHILNPDYDPASVDVPEARLLGARQLAFLEQWAGDWTGAKMKVALSQTIFCGGAHIHGKVGGRLHADLDSNGWPQTGRNKAIAALRKAFAVHVAGDQHLATVFHHGVDGWDDAGYSFCVPSIANLYLRWWRPLTPGGNRAEGQSEILGRHLDGFGNRVTAWAVANPDDAPAGGDKLTTRAAGFGVVRLDTRTRQITFECWPRNVDVSAPETRQYPGWPITISQFDNYGREPVAWLPKIEVSGATDQVVEVVDEAAGEVVYTVRMLGTSFRPKVFRQGAYTVRVGEGAERQTFRSVRSQDLNSGAVLRVEF